ncbi:MAG: PD-(D/E)XK nuclease domain-containing protein, partial [Solobacterium sp.]|nr:PD-(D/E)XK nuclease domain-containing protein [Solobacterium sp.]
TAEELRALLQDRKIDVFLDLEAVYPSSSDSKNTIFSFLLFTGYLTVSGIPEETELGTVVSLSLPNAEVRRIYRTEVLNRIRIPQSGNVIAEIESALRRSDGDRLQEALRKYMISSVSYYDTASEGFYHGMMLGLTASLSTDYIIHSNREAGEGRYDVELEPKNDSLPGIVMEFKACDSARKEDLEKRAEEALEQISEKEYCAELQGKGIRDIVKYGIAFSGKNAAVKTDR